MSLPGIDVDGTVDLFRIAGLPANGTLNSDSALTPAIAPGGQVAATASRTNP